MALLLTASANDAQAARQASSTRLGAAGPQARPGASPAPCLSCLVVEVDGAELESLGADVQVGPSSLMGLSVLVHVARWEGAADMLDGLSRRGAAPGVVVVVGGPAPTAGVLDRTALVRLTATSAGDADAIVFAARTLATAARAARPDVKIRTSACHCRSPASVTSI